MMKAALLVLAAIGCFGCAQGSTGGGGFYYYNGNDSGAGTADTSQTGSTVNLTFGQLAGSWDILFSNWSATSGGATISGNKADVAVVVSDEGQYYYDTCQITQHRWLIHLELVSESVALCSLTDLRKTTGSCPASGDGSTTINFTFQRDSAGTSQFGNAAGSWHLQWPVTQDGNTVACSFALADGASQGCGNAEFQFSSTLVGSILNGKLDSNGSFSAKRK